MYRIKHRQPHTGERSVLASLRSLIPERELHFSEALRIAELQAVRLRQLTDTGDDAIPEGTIAAQRRISIVRRRLPTSGLSYWDGQSWVIALNGEEPEARQRFTLFHEYKHIIDHGQVSRLYTGRANRTAGEQAEQAADYFAGCVLMPKISMKRAWGNRIQTPKGLAEVFGVSPRAAEVRLVQLGLTEPVSRCVPPTAARQRPPSQHRYRADRRARYERKVSV